MDILEVIEKLKELDYDEVEIDSPDFKLSLRRRPQQQVDSPSMAFASLPMDGFTTAKRVKAPGLASDGQVKYCRDVMVKEFGEDEKRMYDFLGHILQLPIQDVPTLEEWDEVLTREMAEVILNSWEQKNGITKKR
jgi:hypothetical protein